MRYSGKIGYGESVENPPGSGKWVHSITEKPYSGNVIRNTRSLEAGQGANDDISVGNTISVVADQYAVSHFSKIKYIMWNGSPWTVTSVEVQHPRLILSLGSVYNGDTA